MNAASLRAQREAAGERALAVAITRRRPDLSDKEVDLLLAEARSAVTWRSAMAGNEAMHISDVLDELARGDLGAILLSARADIASAGPDHAKALEALADNPMARLTYARANGLK